MAPYRKEQLEKFAWSWAENCDPTQITIENVHAAYRILLPRCKIGQCRRNCKGNPHCLSCLGEERWLGCSDDSDSNNLDPEGERRTPGTDAGLKNLGATCYVNSLLQLWFHNFHFRKTIFLWNPLEDPAEKSNTTLNSDCYQPLTVVGHLQSLFALMQYGNTRSIDPTDFIQCLRLDTNTQQDAQEFSKLLLSVLDNNLHHQSIKEVKDFIKDTFCGEYAYVTKCLKCDTVSRCPSTFYELDLHIRGQSTLKDCLKEFMQMELLEGEDKYYCAVCKEKQNAQRFISLTLLPPVLNIQLMRFVFDKNLGFKKKLNTALLFPEILNMTEFLPSSEEIMYNLSAVLVHSGQGANSGHYIAYILDRSTSTWYKYNDEVVEPISKNFKLVNDDDYDDNNGRRIKHPRIPKGSYRSFNAYTLVYTLTKPKNEISKFCGSRVDCRTLTLHPYLENYIKQKNNQFEEYIKQMAQENQGILSQSKQIQLEMASMITLLPVETDDEDFDAVATTFLEAWLKNDSYEKPIDNEEIVCTHGKLDPNNLVYTKYINTEMADTLYDRLGGGPRLRSDQFVCLSCVTNKCFQIRVKNKTNEESKEICCRMRNRINEDSVNYWVGRSSFRSWRRLVLTGINDMICNGENVLSYLNYLDDTIQNYITINNNKYEGTGIPKLAPMKTRSSLKDVSNGDNSKLCSDKRGNNNDVKLCIRQFKVTVPRYSYDANDKSVTPNVGTLVLSPDNKEKLIKCYAYTMEPDCEVPRVSEMLKEVLRDYIPNSNSSTTPAPIDDITTNNSNNCNNYNSEDDNNNTNANDDNSNNYHNVNDGCNNFTNFNNSNDNLTDVKQKLSPVYNNGELNSHVQIDNSDGKVPDEIDINNTNDKCYDDCIVENSVSINNNDEQIDKLLSKKHSHNETLPVNQISAILDDQCRRDDPSANPAKNSYDHANTISSEPLSVEMSSTSSKMTNDSSGDNSSSVSLSSATTVSTMIQTTTSTSQEMENNNPTIRNASNGDDVIVANKVAKTIRFDNEEEIICEEEEMKFNEDLLCVHGDLCIEENNRKLVPPEVWSVFKKYFPFAKEFTSQDEPCYLCKSIASEGEVAKGMYKVEAHNQKELLLDLYLDRNRPLLLYPESIINSMLYFVVNRAFVNEWRKFIKEAGKRDPPCSIKNHSTLLCLDHSKLLYDINTDINEFQNEICLVRENEWQILSQIYKSDAPITMTCLTDGLLITEPDVCLPCSIIRRENEDKAKYCYTNSKIYIKMLTNDEVEFSSDEILPTKRAKMQIGNNGNDTNSLTENTHALVGGFVAPNRPGGMIVETRRSSRCRRKNGVKELTVSSDMSLLDVKKKICSILNVAPMDQHLSTTEGCNLTENASTLRELGILPGVVLNLKIDEPCETDAVEYLQSREPEAGFKGTNLLGC